MQSEKRNKQKIIKIALVGKVNTGKSTLFNRLIEEKKAISFKHSGTTRDKNYGLCYWRDKKFQIIDTGGLTKEKTKTEIDKKVKENVKTAIKEADIIFFITEVKKLESEKEKGTILTDLERNIAKIIKKSKKPSILVLNKADKPKKRSWAENKAWKALGLGKPIAVSSVNGSGIGDLLDITIEKTKKIKPKLTTLPPKQAVKVSIVGKPNVGKSSLFNAIIGRQEVIVSNKPHTTRGPQDTFLYYDSPKFEKLLPITLIDTAGIRKKRKIRPGIEKIGVNRSLRAMRKSDLIIIVVAANEEPGFQEKTLIRLALKTKKALIIVINKCDLLTKKEYRLFTRSNLVYNKLPMATFAPRIFISAKEKQGINVLMQTILEVNQNQNKEITEKELNEFLDKVVKEKNFKQEIWQRINIIQTKKDPLEFTLICPRIIIKRKQIIKPHFNIIKKALRENFYLEGAPIFIKTKCN